MAHLGNKLGRTTGCPRGFTLTELLVAVAILVAMMTLIATIFNTAGKATGTAQNSQKLHRTMQQVAEAIKRDLEMMGEGAPQRILAIAGVQISTIERTDDPVTTARPHRADVMMLLTPREVSPYVSTAFTSGDLDRSKHVVYGHARLGKILSSGWSNVRGLDAIPASKWHLARRVTGFESAGTTWPPDTLVDGKFINAVSNSTLLTDVLTTPFLAVMNPIPPGYYAYRFPSHETLPSSDPPTGTPKLFSYAIRQGADRFAYNPMRLSSGRNYYWLQSDPVFPPGHPLSTLLFWWKPGGAVSGWQRDDPVSGPIYYTGTPIDYTGMVFPAQPGQPVSPPATTDGPRADAYYNNGAGFPTFWPEWFYLGEDSPNSRVQLDPNPDPALGGNRWLSPYFLPACSEFKVEVTFDRVHELPIDADGPGGYVVRQAIDENGVAVNGPVPAAIQWQPVPLGEIWVWNNPSPSAYSGTNDSRQLTDPFVWPTAIRITITAYDPSANLDYPVTTTIVHKF